TPPVPLRTFSYWERVVRAWFSVAVGLVFFYCAAQMNRSEADLKRSLKWLYAGLALTILWGAVQVVAIYTPLIRIQTLSKVQLLFSARRLLNRRVSGFAYEPSWLSDQLVILYFPWLLAAVLANYRLTRFKWLEPVLLLGLLGLEVFTFSRSGILSLAITSVAVIVLTGQRWMRRIWDWFRSPFKEPAKLAGKLLRGGVVLALLAAVAGTFYLLSDYPYFARLWQFNLEGGFIDYIINISAGPRLAYSWAGIQTFAQHPLGGVGLGASGFYLFDNLPDWAYIAMAEVSRRLSPDSNVFPNTKSLYIRLLAETGLVGFWAFAAYLLAILGSVRKLFMQQRYIAIAGLCIWLTVVLRNFTQDSLTFPIMWIGFGIILGLSKASFSQNTAENAKPEQ
ncbi:MAG: hypothetical protein JXB38_00960, partial [Anaerolineales bacterium]|nr:hypothetical protein [Anaerolineales bacterium]